MFNTIRRQVLRLRPARLLTYVPLACLIILPLLSLTRSEAGPVARLAVVGMLALATCRPSDALLVCAGLTPLAGSLGALLGAPVGFAEGFVLAFLGGWLLNEAARSPRTDPARRTMVIPAVLFACAVAASSAVQMIALQASADDRSMFLRQVGIFLTFGYFPDHRQYVPITAGNLLLEGVGLYASVVTLCRRDGSLGQRVAGMVAACGAGVAALNINRLLVVSLRSGASLWDLVVDSNPIRISHAFPDVNAAGSYFAMILLLASGLFLGRRRLRLAWMVAAGVVAGALWLTGSRAALIAVPISAVLMFAMAAALRRRSVVKLVPAGAAALVLVALMTGYFSRTSGRYLLENVNVRVELTRVGLKMFAAHPLFGVGVGRYSFVSAGFTKPELPSALRRENAHNNFLQILAELGIVGFAAFSWLLFVVGRWVWLVLRGVGLSPEATGVAGGLTAFLLSCLAGHPLLIQEASYAFWLVLGLAVGLAPAPSPTAGLANAGRPRSWQSIVTRAVVLMLVVSVPLRARQMTTEARTGRPPVGLSGWQTDKDGVSFRWMDDRAQFSIPAVARAVRLPLRLEGPANAAPRTVEIYLDGHFMARINLTGGDWHEFRFIVPPAPPGTRYRRIELRVPPYNAEVGTAARRQESVPPRIKVGQPRLTRQPD